MGLKPSKCGWLPIALPTLHLSTLLSIKCWGVTLCVCVDWTNAISKDSRNAIYLHPFLCWNKEFQPIEFAALERPQMCGKSVLCDTGKPSLKARQVQVPRSISILQWSNMTMLTPNHLQEKSYFCTSESWLCERATWAPALLSGWWDGLQIQLQRLVHQE